MKQCKTKKNVMVPLFSTLSSLDAKLSISVLLSCKFLCILLICSVAVFRSLLRVLTVVFKSDSPTVLLTGSAADAGLLGEGTWACSSSGTVVAAAADVDVADVPDFFLLDGAIIFYVL